MWEKKKTIKPLFLFVFIVAVLGIVLSVFFYIQYQGAQNLINHSGIAQQMQVKDVVTKVSKLMLLPQDEQPVLETVSDSKKLKDQPFFKDAQNGDQVLIYAKAKTAILYDPKMNKIISVTPVTFGQQTTTSIRIALYNWTATTGLTNTIEQQLKSKLNNIVISTKDTAKNKYTKTIVIDLTGNQQQAATKLASLLGGDVTSLPNGEISPKDSDLLVIIGK
jgi:hypothetical protein